MKKFNNFIPNVAIFSFGNSQVTKLYKIPFDTRSRVKYVRIGSKSLEDEQKNMTEAFVNWHKKDYNGNYKKKVLSPEKFFEIHYPEVRDAIESADLIIIPVPTQDVDAVRYASYFSRYAKEKDILIFHLLVHSIIFSDQLEKVLKQYNQDVKENRNIIVDLHEINLLHQFENADLINRDQFVSRALNNLATSIISSFLEIDLNPRLYNRIKAQTLLRDTQFPEVWLGAYGSSNVKDDRFEKALFNALSSAIFRAAYQATNKFFVIISGTFLSEKKIMHVKEVLKSIAGPDAEVITARVVEDYVFENVVNVTIFARDINNEKLLDDDQKIHQSISTTLLKLRDLIQNEETQEYILGGSRTKVKFENNENT